MIDAGKTYRRWREGEQRENEYSMVPNSRESFTVGMGANGQLESYWKYVGGIYYFVRWSRQVDNTCLQYQYIKKNIPLLNR